MSPAIDHLPITSTLTQGYMPDFLIAFTFFTSLSFAILHKRFSHRPAAAGMAISLGLTLASGLTWWEYNHNLTIRNTGSIGILLSLLLIGSIIYHTIKQTGSKSAAIIITLTIILTFISLNNTLPFNPANLYTLIFTLPLLGFIILAIIMTTNQAQPHNSGLAQTSEAPDETLKRIHRDRNLNFNLDKHLRKLKNEAQLLKRDPAQAPHFYQYISSLLPAEGYLTQRMAQLREKAHKIRSGHLARLQETKSLTKTLPPSQLAKLSSQLISSYYSEQDFEKRLERLDTAVATNEKKIIDLLKQAKLCSKEYKFQHIPNLIEHAEKLQHQNDKLFKLIEHTENKLSELAQKIAKQHKEEYKNAHIK